MQLPIIIHGQVVRGSGRGKKIGTPTINVDPKCAEKSLSFGVYACFLLEKEHTMKAVLHYGPRPVFRDSLSFEVHILDTHLTHRPIEVKIEVIARIRDIQNFRSTKELQARIQKDIVLARGMLQGA